MQRRHLQAAAAPATVSGEHRPKSHCRLSYAGGKAEAMRNMPRESREPGDLPTRVAHHPRGACGRADHRSGDDPVCRELEVVPVMSAREKQR